MHFELVFSLNEEDPFTGRTPSCEDALSEKSGEYKGLNNYEHSQGALLYSEGEKQVLRQHV